MSQADSPNTTTPPRRALLAGAPAVAAAALAGGTVINALAIAEAKACTADPIFAVIAEHQAALKAYLAASHVDGGLMDHSPEWEIARPVTLAAEARERLALEAVFATAPTTLAGVAALLAHVGQHEFLDEEADHSDRETLLSTLNEGFPEWKRIGQDFPLRLAATLRSLIAAA